MKHTTLIGLNYISIYPTNTLVLNTDNSKVIQIKELQPKLKDKWNKLFIKLPETEGKSNMFTNPFSTPIIIFSIVYWITYVIYKRTYINPTFTLLKNGGYPNDNLTPIITWIYLSIVILIAIYFIICEHKSNN